MRSPVACIGGGAFLVPTDLAFVKEYLHSEALIAKVANLLEFSEHADSTEYHQSRRWRKLL